jgi:NADH-quinone oxidoreductase subunit G
MSRVRLTIDGVEREVEAGQDLLTASLGLGVAIPHFCWHAALGSVGACRLCAVRVHTGPEDETGRVEMACMTPVSEGQRVEAADPEAAEMRARVIEWLMVNHPHDCAVCEEGGACHLQDMVVASGHHRRRYRFAKRTHRNQDLGPLLTHEMNRCIACYRCTRFYRGYAGGRDLDVFGAHDRVYFGRYEDGPLESPFAGNLAEVCPTGVFNDRGWSEHYARKWDMAATPSVCTQCSVGCNIFAAERDGRLRRVQNRYHGAINGHFLCDRGRFGALHVHEGRLEQPCIGGAAATEAEALAAARAALAQGAVGIGSPRASLETNAALRRLVGPDGFFGAVAEREGRAVGRMARRLAAGRGAALADIAAADAVLVLGEDLTGTAPRAALALRQAARGAADALAAEKGVPAWLDNAARVAGEGRKSPIALVTPRPDALDDVATWALRREPAEIAGFGHAVAAALGGATDDPEARAVAEALAAAAAPLVVAGVGTGRGDVAEAAAAVADALGSRARVAFFPPEANSLGLALMGAGGLERAVAALERGEARTAIIAEADLAERVDPALAERLFAAAETVIVLDSAETATATRADIVLPVADWSEAAGTWVNHEGRAQRAFAVTATVRRAGWRVIADLFETHPGWATLDDMLAALAHDLPALAPARHAAPDAATRTTLGRIARAPWRVSGRTAHDLAGRVPEGTPPPDPDSALAFSMEGAPGAAAPPALRTGFTVPGLHSASAVPLFTDGPRGPLKGGDPGVSVLCAPIAAPEGLPDEMPEGDGLMPILLHEPFAGDELGRRAARLAARCPAPVVLLHPEDAAALGLAAGDPVSVAGGPAAAVALDDALPRGHVAASAGRVLPRGLSGRVRVEAVR